MTKEKDPIRVATGKKSRDKGASNERKCAETIGAWTGKKFTRTPSSGGLRWKSAKRVASDLVCEEEDFNFPLSVETKHFAEMVLHNGIVPAKARLYTIWLQAMRDAVRCGKLPCLFLRINRVITSFKYNGETLQDYYFILDTQFGGNALALYCKQHLKGDKLPIIVQGVEGATSIRGYKLSEVMNRLTYPEFLSLIENSNLVDKFLETWQEK